MKAPSTTKKRYYVPSDLNLSLRGEILEILVTEGNNLLLSNEEGALVETLLRELRDLHARDDSAEEGRELLDLDAILQQVGLLGISAKSGVGGDRSQQFRRRRVRRDER